jgi:hypothetical protein
MDCVKIPHASYLRLMGLAKESGRDPGDLCAYAIAIFCTAVSNINLMHPPKTSPRAKPKEQRSPIAPIGATVARTIRKLKKGGKI